MPGVVFEHARVEEPREHLAGRGGAAHDLGGLLARSVEVGRRQRLARPARHHLAVAHDPFHDRRRESARRLPHPARHEVDHRLGEGEFARIREQVGGVHAVRHEHQREIAHRLARGRHLHDVAEQVIHVGVGAAHLLPAVAEAEGFRLLQEIRELAAGHFVEVEVGIGRLHVALERRVVVAHSGPIVGEVPQRLRVEAGVERGVPRRIDEGIQVWLAREAGERGECGVDDAGAVPGRFKERGHLGARRVVRVEVDRDADLSTQGGHQLARGERLAEARHVLDGEHVGSELLEFLGELHVVVERILRALRVEHVARVADRRLADRTALHDRVDRHLHVRHPVERVEHAKHVDAGVGRLLHERLHDVVGIVRVADGVAGSQEHLEEHVRNPLAQQQQPVPGALLEKPHGGVERGPAPHLERKEAGCEPGVGVGHGQHVVGAHPRGEQRLMGVAHRRVGDQQLPVRAHPGGELRGAELLELGPRSGRRSREAVVFRERSGLTACCGGPALHERVAVDDHVGEVFEELRGPIFADGKVEQCRRLVDEAGRALAGQELRVRHQVHEERDVRLHAADAKLLQAPLHMAGRLLEREAAGRHLHEQRVEVGCDHGPGKRRSRVEADAHAAGGAVCGDPAVVGQEAVLRILGRDAALHRRAHRLDRRLIAEADLRVGELVALGHAELPADDVDAGDLLGDGVLHLDPRIDLDEEKLAGVGIDEKLDRAGVLVLRRAADGERSLADGVAGLRRQVRGGGDLDDLLMPPLHRAVALEEVHEVAVEVAEQLHLDVPGPLDELLDEHRRAAEGRLALTLGAFERHGQLVFAAHHAHAAAAAAVGRLEDHGPAELLGDCQRVGRARDRLRAAGEDRHAGPLGEVAGGRLIAEHLEEFDPRAHERDARLLARRGEGGVLREEPVSRMDRIHAVVLGERDDRLDVEVAAERLARLADEIRFVGLEAVEREAVFVGVDRDGADAELVGGAEDADRDLAAVGDEQFGDGTHGGWRRPVGRRGADETSRNRTCFTHRGQACASSRQGGRLVGVGGPEVVGHQGSRSVAVAGGVQPCGEVGNLRRRRQPGLARRHGEVGSLQKCGGDDREARAGDVGRAGERGDPFGRRDEPWRRECVARGSVGRRHRLRHEQVAPARVICQVEWLGCCAHEPCGAPGDDIEAGYADERGAGGPGDGLRRGEPDAQPRERAGAADHADELDVADLPAEAVRGFFECGGDPARVLARDRQFDLDRATGGRCRHRTGGETRVDGECSHGRAAPCLTVVSGVRRVSFSATSISPEIWSAGS